MANDLLHHFGGLADQQSAVQSPLGVVVPPRHGRPAALSRHGVHGTGVTGKEVIRRFLRRSGDVAERVDANLEALERVSRLLAGLAIEVDERAERSEERRVGKEWRGGWAR